MVLDQIESSSSGADSSFEFLAMSYDELDIMLKDINEEELDKIGLDQEIRHLGPATFTNPAFPVEGIFHGPNNRLMIPLNFQRSRKPDSPVFTVWCLVDTGSPFTCLSVKTLEAFFGAGNVDDRRFYSFAIQDHSTRIECQVSKVGTHFEHANILGFDALRSLNVSLIMKWHENYFTLARM